MPQRLLHILQSDTAEALGYTFTGVSVSTIIAEYLGSFQLNEVLKAIMFIGTILFTFFKSYNSYLDSRGKKLDNCIKRHELKKLDDESKKLL